MNLKTAEFIFADCQSTGASPANGNILEIAWCRANALAEPENISSYILQQPPDRPIPFIIQSITGIGENEMSNAIAPADAYLSFSDFFANPECPANFAVIHYGRFEKSFFDHWHQTFGQSQDPLPYRILCTHEIAKRIFPNLPTRGINGLAGFFGATIHDTKRSASHVHATWLIWRGLVEELYKLGVNTTHELEEWLATVKVAKRGKLDYPLEKSKRTTLPNRPGVYRMFDRAGNILYVGKATSLKSRVNSYFRGRAGKDARRLEMLTRAYDLVVTECDTPLEAAILETDEIKRLNPPYNVVLKAGRRQLIYYDKKLQEWSLAKDAAHPLGPFSGPYMIEPLIRLSSSIQTEEFDPLIFFDFIESGMLKEAFSIFSDKWQVPNTHTTPRQFMAFALRQYKRLLRMKATVETQLDEDDPDDTADSVLQVDDENETLTDLELTPEEIAEKFERMFLRAAKAYLQAKILCALANSSVSFKDGGYAKILRVSQGVISEVTRENFKSMGSSYRAIELSDSIQGLRIAESDSESAISNESSIGNSMDLVTFDRMRVLLSELGRVSSTGAAVKIQYDGSLCAPVWVLRRSII